MPLMFILVQCLAPLKVHYCKMILSRNDFLWSSIEFNLYWTRNISLLGWDWRSLTTIQILDQLRKHSILRTSVSSQQLVKASQSLFSDSNLPTDQSTF